MKLSGGTEKIAYINVSMMNHRAALSLGNKQNTINKAKKLALSFKLVSRPTPAVPLKGSRGGKNRTAWGT